ncbi:phosphoribosylanthranilate isomerase [Castellaniella sp.]|uniref:phosphoribosylanthranilate isomerase n=1 Tax=Castellaniella sp. TaxID=1955812 RepID=UPI003C758409
MTSRTRVKICGLTRPQDVQAVVAAGADAVGLVFYPASRRLVSLKDAARLRASVPAFVSVVALFVNPDAADVRRTIQSVQPDLLQFHGDETPAFCAQFDHRYLKAFRIGAPGLDTPEGVVAHCLQYPHASGWLFDSYSPAYGGSGRKFDQSLLSQVPRGQSHPVWVLSGGLSADTVGASIHTWHPHAVDISSGVETAPGLKDAKKVQAFLEAVRLADETGRLE